MEDIKTYIQKRWKAGLLPGVDCILFGNGTIIIGNCYCLIDSETNRKRRYWYPLCDTTIESMEKYQPDIWTNIDILHGSFEYENQVIVFGEGSMGNEGFVASTNNDGDLNWGIFFTFSNPINQAEVQGQQLLCKSGNGDVWITIKLNDLTKIKITYQNQ